LQRFQKCFYLANICILTRLVNIPSIFWKIELIS